MKLYRLIIIVFITFSISGCMTIEERQLAEKEKCEQLIITHLNNPMCDQFDYYKNTGNGDVNTRGGYTSVKNIAIKNCQKARECIGIVESKYEKATWTNSPAVASPYLHQKADGKEKGNVVIEISKTMGSKEINEVGNLVRAGAKTISDVILDAISLHKDKLDTVFTVEAKQGVFIETNSPKITFKLNDFLEAKGRIELGYRTYDCNEESIINKEFETFIIGVDSATGVIKLREFNAPFACYPYYTVTTSQKITTTVKPIENYRGISKDLKSYQEDKDTYYIYIDADKAKIVQYHVDTKSTRKIHIEKYKLNMDSCQYEIEKEDKLIKNMGGSDILKSEDAGWGFEDDTKIDVVLPSSEKTLSFTWGSLRENGHYHANKKYKKDIPQIVKSMMGKVNNMATLFRKESKRSEGMELFKSLYDYPGTSKEVQCGGKVAMESLLIPPLDGLQDPDVEFNIDIRLSTESEIKILKNKMNIK